MKAIRVLVVVASRLRTCCGVVLLGLLVVSCLPAGAQEASVPASSNVIVPPFVRFSGVLADVKGSPLTGVVGVTFSLYKDSETEVPVWTEVQNVYPDHAGRYSVMLGAEKSTGLPTDIFVSGEGRWLSVQAEGQPEQARVLLLSVPYALKAADAETLGGRPASAYLLNPQPTEGVTTATHGNPAATSEAANIHGSAVSAAITGGGTANFIPLWTSSSNLGNSVVYQSTTGLGIGTTSPLATLDIRKATGVRAITSGNGIAIFGNAAVGSGTGKGIEGDTNSTVGTGVAGTANATTGFTQGVWGSSLSTGGVGVIGQAYATSGSTIGVEGISASSAGTAGVFNNTAGGNVLSGQTDGTVVFSVNGAGITQVGAQSTTPAGILNVTSTSASYAGLVATGSLGNSTSINGTTGVIGTGGNGEGVDNPFGGTGVVGNGGSASVNGGAGVVGTGGLGTSASFVGGPGVVGNGGGLPANYGVSANIFVGVVGNGSSDGFFGSPGVVANGGGGGFAGGDGIQASGAPNQNILNVGGGAGVVATGGAANPGFGGAGDGIYATNASGGTIATGGYAGDFGGDINVTGAVYAGTKDFKIDHPTDPANRYLLHASVESSEMVNIYSGNVTLDGSGEAVVQLPVWFEAVNGDFRYQLTSIGAPGPGLYIAQEISGSRFKIGGGTAGSKVSWQVTGVRQDAYAKANPLIVEQEKSAIERGYYIHPELYGASAGKSIASLRHPRPKHEATMNRAGLQQQKTLHRPVEARTK